MGIQLFKRRSAAKGTTFFQKVPVRLWDHWIRTYFAMKVPLLAITLGLLLTSSASLSLSGQPQAAAASSSKEDDRIEDLVRVRLAGNRDTGGAGQIKVAVKAGVVTLSGNVDSERVKSAAEKQAKKVKGVKGVTNQLAIAPKS